MQFICENTENLTAIARSIIKSFPDNRVFALFGKMGAGKTTLTKELCKALDVVDVVNSPTFAIINEYLTRNNDYVYHFDCYRLKNTGEFTDIGGTDYFYSDCYCFIEWPQIIEDLLPDDCISITIDVDKNNLNRIINVQ